MRTWTSISQVFIALILNWSSSLASAKPAWADNSATLIGRMLRVVCFGEGPAVDLARDEAISICKASAAKFVTAPTKVESKLVETEQEVIYIGKAETSFQVDGLACVPEKEFVEKGRDIVSVWLRCRFDLSKAKLLERGTVDPSDPATSSMIRKSETRRLIVTSIPKCSDIVVVGPSSKVFSCNTNPTSVILDGTVTGIIVRAKGYESKQIAVQELGDDLFVNFE